MIKQEETLPAVDLIREQLTLRMIVWDITGTGDGETVKLERELELFGINRLYMPVQCLSIEKDMLECHEKYKKIYQLLEINGFTEAEALLVTEDAGLATYVYQRRKEKADDLAVVYYEGENALTDRIVQKNEDGRGNVLADMIVQGFEEIGVQFLDRVHKRRNGLPWNILYTKRTCVREMTLSDLDELFELYAGEGITDYTEPLFEREKEEEYTKSYISYMYRYFGYGMWIVLDRASGQMLGRAGIEHHDDGGNEENEKVLMELGYIIRKEYQNKGYATEVCQAILEYAREELEISQIHCFIHPQNHASIRVAEKLGFSKCGSSRQGSMVHFCRELSGSAVNA